MPVVGAYLSTDDQPQCLGAMRYGVIHRQVQFLPLHKLNNYQGVRCFTHKKNASRFITATIVKC